MANMANNLIVKYLNKDDSGNHHPVSKKAIKENITPHKIAVVILIQEYCNIKSEVLKKNGVDDTFSELTKSPEPHFQRDFCMLILHLIQCPDMNLFELISLLQGGKYKLTTHLLDNFINEIEGLTMKDVGSIMDIITNLSRLLIDPISYNMSPLVNKSSPLGVYLRRSMLYFDKLTYSQTVSLYRAFQNYVRLGKQSQTYPIKKNPFKLETSNKTRYSQTSVSIIESINMDMSPVAEPTVDSVLHDIENNKFEEENVVEEVPALWSRRQAELFIARQTTWLQNNETSALSPTKLQQVIHQVLKANPDHFEAHYLSYLNCLRVKELAGAIDSLYHFFDRNTSSSQDKEAKIYRYAALNLAILHAEFGHKIEALSALKEAFWLSHEVNDNVCLQHAQAWQFKLSNDNKEILMERSISKCSDLNLNYLTSLGLQSFAQFAGTTGGKPALVFEVLMRSEVLNCQFSMMDLMAHSFTHKAALWTLYGKADMASLSSQLLLHLDTIDSIQGLNSYNGEATCQAICNIALRLTELGEYDLAMIIVDHAKERFPQSSSWQLSEQVLYFTRNLYQGQWQAAESAVRQLSTIDKWEAHLRKGELLLAKGDCSGAQEAVTTVMDGGHYLCPSVRVRAMLLAARCSQSVAVSILTGALSVANYHYLDYVTALVAMQLAQVQLQMNLPNQALKLMDQSLLVVLSHGGYYDQASALLLFVYCKVASVAVAPPDLRNEVLADAISLLNKVKENFYQVEAFSKVKETVYLQCVLANELNCVLERNKFAYDFRMLDEEFPSFCQV